MSEKCIIFDMDGTLIDSKKAITNSVNYVRSALNLEPISEILIYKYINNPDENLSLRFYNEKSFTPKLKKLFYEHYIVECVKNIKVYEDIENLLSFFYKKTKLAIATNAYDVFAKKIMDSLDFSKYFSLIIGANTVNSSKPDPKMIEYILQSLHVNSQSAVLIGDSQKDELCAKNANINFIFAAWGYGDYVCKDMHICQKSTQLKDKILEIFPTLLKD